MKMNDTGLEHMETLEIPLSKTKLRLAVAVSVVIIGVGLGMIFFDLIGKPDFGSIIIAVMGLIVIIAGAIALVTNAVKLKDARPGLIVNAEGIVSNTGDDYTGLIPWGDIMGVKWVIYTGGNCAGEQKLAVVVYNPDDYIARGSGVIARKGMQICLKQYGTPVVITAAFLKIKTLDLGQLLTQRLEAHRQMKEAEWKTQDDKETH